MSALTDPFAELEKQPYTGPRTGQQLAAIDALEEIAQAQATAALRRTAELPVYAGLKTGDQIALLEEEASRHVPVRHVGRGHRDGRLHALPGARHPAVLAAGEAPRGALAPSYDIPRAAYRRRLAPVAAVGAAAVVAVAMWRHAVFIEAYGAYRALMAAWALAFAFIAFQWLLSWLDRPARVTEAQQRRLDQLSVVVNIPVYNEDPATLDRTLYAVFAQARLPQHVEVVDDGSTVDYSAVRDHWAAAAPPGTALSWRRKANAGKKHAQAVTFGTHPEADVFVTMDSDTALERMAIAEGLKPFADRRVWSVAGMELAFNARANWLTRTVSARTLIFQVVACGVQSVLGDVLVNRGPFALYRAQLLRDVLPAYLGETFLGMPVRLGDDAALTLFARGRGRAVQQSSAFAFSMFPESLSHHLRQWERWMRGSTIRNCWRLRYLPLWSFGWWFTFLSTWFFLSSSATTVIAAVDWRSSAGYAGTSLIAMAAWSYLTGLRLLCVRRSDEGVADRVMHVLAYPAAGLWSAFVLRPARFHAIATYRRQGWTTRQQVEITIVDRVREIPEATA
jgi:hyaluronan synthase